MEDALRNLAPVLGLIAGALAWAAALITYFKTGAIKWELIAAGVFVAAMSFAGWGKPKDPPASK